MAPSSPLEAMLSSAPQCKEASEIDVTNNHGKSPTIFTVYGSKIGGLI